MEIGPDNIFSQWISQGVNVNAKASPDDLKHAEAALGFVFPDDFNQLYSKMNGFLDLDWQEHMFSFWSLERIIEEYADNRDKNFIGFCDFLLASHFIGFKKDQPGVFKMYSNQSRAEDILIAKTFSIAVDMINLNSDLIY